tara:strand:+ start:776 stop:955 length:180 start_codon:yes stop_codon:yes gene_type:complete
MNRLAAAIGIVDAEGIDFAIVKFVFWQDAVLVAGLEENDRGHKGAGEAPGVLLGEFEVV